MIRKLLAMLREIFKRDDNPPAWLNNGESRKDWTQP